MNAVFALGNRASAEDIRDRLAHRPVCRWCRWCCLACGAKGRLRHQRQGGRNVYSATPSPATGKRAALRQYLHPF